MKLLCTVLLSALLAISTPLVHALSPVRVEAPHHAALNKVVEDFRMAIIKKDKALFMSLFPDAPAPVSWATTTGPAEQARRIAAGLNVERSSTGGNHIGFIDSIVANPKPTEEKFWNVKTSSDGSIAQIYFDYSFHSGNVKTNWGKEAWQLINTNKGWKIVSVVWSADFPAGPKRKPITLSAQALAEFAGNYSIEKGPALRVVQTGERLEMAIGKNRMIPLVPEAASRFYEELHQGTIEFTRDAQGKVSGLVISENGEEMERATRDN